MSTYWAAVAVVSAPLALIAGRVLIFPGQGSFLESLKYLFLPDLYSFLTGQHQEDNWATMKLVFFAVLCAAIGWGVHGRFGPAIAQLLGVPLP